MWAGDCRNFRLGGDQRILFSFEQNTFAKLNEIKKKQIIIHRLIDAFTWNNTRFDVVYLIFSVETITFLSLFCFRFNWNFCAECSGKLFFKNSNHFFFYILGESTEKLANRLSSIIHYAVCVYAKIQRFGNIRNVRKSFIREKKLFYFKMRCWCDVVTNMQLNYLKLSH